MNTHYEKAMNSWENLKLNALEFGSEARLAIEQEGKTIRDFCVDLGDMTLEDKIGRYIMASEFVESLNPHQYGNVQDWLTPTHYTELRKIEAATDHENALDLMQELITEDDRGQVHVKSAAWLRSKRDGEEASTATIYHRVWKWAVKALADAQGNLSRKGLLADRRDRRRARLLASVVREFSADKIAWAEGER